MIGPALVIGRNIAINPKKIMFRNCLNVAVRNLSKNLFYSLTSIAGLALGTGLRFSHRSIFEARIEL